MAKQELESAKKDLRELNSILREYSRAPYQEVAARGQGQSQKRLRNLQDSWMKYAADFMVWTSIADTTSDEQRTDNPTVMIEQLNVILDMQARASARPEAASKPPRRSPDAKYEEVLRALQKGLPHTTGSKSEETGPFQVLEHFERGLIKAGLPKEQAQAARRSAERAIEEDTGGSGSRTLTGRSVQYRILCVDESQGSRSTVNMILFLQQADDDF